MFYDIDKRIGKKVWVFEEKEYGIPVLNQDKVWVVESLHEPDETHHDYYFTIVNGEDRKEVIWYRVVVIPTEQDDEITRISTYLRDNGFYKDEMWHETVIGVRLVRIAVNWGDWKHDHGWLDDLMGHIGYECLGRIVTEEDGSDCYSADHLFIHKENPKYELLMSAKKLFA